VPETCLPQFDDALSAESEPRFVVKVGNLLFPAFVRPARWEFHQLPQFHPENGTSACWARSLRPSLRKKLPGQLLGADSPANQAAIQFS
jgi:hypothetical protein